MDWEVIWDATRREYILLTRRTRICRLCRRLEWVLSEDRRIVRLTYTGGLPVLHK